MSGSVYDCTTGLSTHGRWPAAGAGFKTCKLTALLSREEMNKHVLSNTHVQPPPKQDPPRRQQRKKWWNNNLARKEPEGRERGATRGEGVVVRRIKRRTTRRGDFCSRNQEENGGGLLFEEQRGGTTRGGRVLFSKLQNNNPLHPSIEGIWLFSWVLKQGNLRYHNKGLQHIKCFPYYGNLS